MSTLHSMAWLSGLAYEDWDNIHIQLEKQGLHMVGDPFNHMFAQGMLVQHNRNAWAALVFRGTEASKGSWGDLWSNVGIPRYWAGQGKAHSGYRNHFSMIRYDARQAAEHVPSTTPLYVTGHSMGGSLATMYASWIGSGGQHDHKVGGLITFGAPKTLSKAAVATIACPTHRVTNKYDFAPHWPPVPGLVHPETEVSIDSGGWPGPVSRHNIDRYIEVLQSQPPKLLNKKD